VIVFEGERMADGISKTTLIVGIIIAIIGVSLISTVASMQFALFQGPKGDKGDTEEQGPQGIQGPRGIQGPIGPDENFSVANMSGWLCLTLTSLEFGYTSKCEYSYAIDNQMWACKFSCPEPANATGIMVYLEQSSIYYPKIKCAIFAENDSDPTYPGVLLGQTDEWTITTGWDDWALFNLTSVITLNETEYYLVVWPDNDVYVFYDNGETHQLALRSETYGSNFPSSWTVIGTSRQPFKTSIYCLYERIAPQYSNLRTSDIRAEFPATVQVDWTDNSGLSSWKLHENNSGTFELHTGTFSGTSNSSEYQLTLNNSYHNVVFWFEANNTNNVWKVTNNYTLKIVWRWYDEDYLNVVGDAAKGIMTEPLGHSLQRRMFYAENNELWTIFYAGYNTSGTCNCLSYSFSSDGMNWTTDNIIMNGGYDGGRFEAKYENRNSKDYVHILYCDENPDSALMYRRGEIESDGDINWTDAETIWQQDDWKVAPQGIVVTESGYVFLQYQCQNWTEYGNNWVAQDQYITFSNKTDGTWEMYTGYPQKIWNATVNDNEYTIETSLVGINDTSVYSILSQGYFSEGQETIKGRPLLNHVIQSIENATTHYVKESRYFCSVSENGNVHLVYHSNTSEIYYCFRNRTTSTWTIQDELIDNAPDASTFPVIGADLESNEIFVHWFKNSEEAWFKMRNTSGWTDTRRMFVIGSAIYRYDSNTVVPYSYNHQILFAYSDKNSDVWGYVFVGFVKDYILERACIILAVLVLIGALVVAAYSMGRKASQKT
jgi:hypothetical protein